MKLILAFLAVFVLWQVLYPLRSTLYPGNVLWNEVGCPLSWRMKLRNKQCKYAMALAAQEEVGDGTQQWRMYHIDWESHMHGKQARRMVGQIVLLGQLTTHLADHYQEVLALRERPRLHVAGHCDLNYRGYHRWLLPSHDMAAIDAWDWNVLADLVEPLPPMDEAAAHYFPWNNLDWLLYPLSHSQVRQFKKPRDDVYSAKEELWDFLAAEYPNHLGVVIPDSSGEEEEGTLESDWKEEEDAVLAETATKVEEEEEEEEDGERDGEGNDEVVDMEEEEEEVTSVELEEEQEQKEDEEEEQQKEQEEGQEEEEQEEQEKEEEKAEDEKKAEQTEDSEEMREEKETLTTTILFNFEAVSFEDYPILAKELRARRKKGVV